MTDLGYFEKCWAAACIKQNSTFYKDNGEQGDANDCMSLYEYCKFRGVDVKSAFQGIDMDVKSDESLMKFYVMKCGPGKDGLGEGQGVDIVTDNSGRDICRVYFEGNELKVDIAKHIRDKNLKILKKASISKDGTTIEIGDVQELEKILEPTTFKGVVMALAKNGTLELKGKEYARKVIKEANLSKEEIERAGLKGELREAQGKEESEEDKEEEPEVAIDDQTADLIRDNGLKPGRVMEIKENVNPEVLAGMTNDSRVLPNGGPVTLIRYNDSDGSTLNNKVLIVQDGQMLRHNGENDQKMTEVMKANRGEDNMYGLIDTVSEDMRAEILEIKARCDDFEARSADLPEEEKAKAFAGYTEEIRDVMAKYHYNEGPENQVVEAEVEEHTEEIEEKQVEAEEKAEEQEEEEDNPYPSRPEERFLQDDEDNNNNIF
ncbi:MAG: hypothetical protein IKN74_04185 [Clostridia bacterium]|nr:hypothetical protein [Clostridia bacterium]